MSYAQVEEPDGLRRAHDRLDDRATRRGCRSQRKLVAAVIYNRLHEGMPLGIDATIRFATGNYTQPLTESELAVDSPYNTRTNAGLPPGPIDSPGLASIEAAAHPAKADYLFYVTKPGACGEARLLQDRSRIRSRRRPLQRGARSGRRQLAGHLRGIAVPRLAVLGHPVGALALAGDAERGAGRAGAGGGVELRGDRRRPGGVRGAGAGDAGRRLRRRQRHRPPQGRGAGARRRRSSETAREIGAANTLGLRRRRDRGRQHRRRRPAGARCRAAARASGRWCSAPAAPPGRWSGRWCGRGPRSRSGTAPRCAPSDLCAELGGERRSPSPTRAPTS